MKDLLEHLNAYLAKTLRAAEDAKEHDIAIVCIDAQAKLAEARLKRYHAKVAKIAEDAAEMKP